jgi:hypothetical protein
MWTDILARRYEFGPQARVCPGAKQIEWHRRECREHRLDERLSTGSVHRTRTVHAMQEFGRCDGGDTDVVVVTQFPPKARRDLAHGLMGGKAADLALELNEDGGV